MKPATSTARALLAKLTALAERGVNGEATAAKRKLDRLKRKFDFEAPDLTSTPELFAGVFKPAGAALRVRTFDRSQFDVANSVKWAIEQNTGIQCSFRGDGLELYASAMPDTATNLGRIAGTVTESFEELWRQFCAVAGGNPLDRSVFVRGLFDGMMGEEHPAGEPLPRRTVTARPIKSRKKQAMNLAPGVSLHPYSTAANLGKQIRFSVPLDRLTEELNDMAGAVKGELSE